VHEQADERAGGGFLEQARHEQEVIVVHPDEMARFVNLGDACGIGRVGLWVGERCLSEMPPWIHRTCGYLTHTNSILPRSRDHGSHKNPGSLTSRLSCTPSPRPIFSVDHSSCPQGWFQFGICHGGSKIYQSTTSSKLHL
jgi:hypothetical protein